MIWEGGGPRAFGRIARLAAIAGVAKGPGFLIPVIIASFFGAGSLTDAYFLAYGGVLLVGGTVGQPLEAAVVPFAAHALALGRQVAGHFMRAVVRQGLGLGLVATVIGALLLAGGLLLTHSGGVGIPRVMMFYVLLSPGAVAWCVASLYTGSLAASGQLEVGAAGYGFRGVGALGGALAGAGLHQLWPVAVGVSLGECSRVFWLRVHWDRMLSRTDEGAGDLSRNGFGTAAAHQMAAQGFLSGAQFIERLLVGTVAVAAISRVEYANRLLTVAAVLFDSAIGPWLLARWSNVFVKQHLKSDWTTVYKLLSIAGAAAFLVSAALVVAAPQIVAVVLHHGAFTTSDADVVTVVLRWYAVGYFFNMSSLCVDRLLLARTQNRLFAGLAALRASTRVVTVLLLIRAAGVVALPIGYVISEAIYLAAVLFGSRQGTGLLIPAREA